MVVRSVFTSSFITFLLLCPQRRAVGFIDWLDFTSTNEAVCDADRSRAWTTLCEHDPIAQARLAAELLRFDEVLDEDAAIRFDDAL